MAAYTGTLIAVRDVDSLRRRVQAWRREGRSVALVPTMGALHDGHIANMKIALKMADRVIATIFVNPKQFGPSEDFVAYPRRESEDFELLSAAGVHLLFAPEVAAMYPPGFASTVRITGLTDILDGAHRAGHFDGVATVVAKLLLQAQPDIALFGDKDYQQLTVIRRLVADLNIPVDVIGVPTVREPDGLAMSSRNVYLTPAERVRAPVLYRAISACTSAISGGADIAAAVATARAEILKGGFREIDYVEARHAETLAPLTNRSEPGRVLAAAHLGLARLIDNLPIPHA
ncbi:MAG: pantoate--beta-alanine ligase [Rhodospirillaceae bacterium]|nr:pantoate--beta-alanine ligase [Rhodospirillaceae bacterium]